MIKCLCLVQGQVHSRCSVNVISLLLPHPYLMEFKFMQRQDWEAQATGGHTKKGGFRAGCMVMVTAGD